MDETTGTGGGLTAAEAASALGKHAAGVPKHLTPEGVAQRQEHIARVNALRRERFAKGLDAAGNPKPATVPARGSLVRRVRKEEPVKTQVASGKLVLKRRRPIIRTATIYAGD